MTDYWPEDGVYMIKRYREPRRRRGVYYQAVRPVDGEVAFNDLGRSAGFVHFADPDTGAKLGFCGVVYFHENAQKIG